MSSDVRVQLVSPVSNFNKKFVGKEIDVGSFAWIDLDEDGSFEWLWEDFFMVTLHAYAARVSLVPLCCIQLQWPVSLWDLEQLPKMIFVTCIIRTSIPCEVWDCDDGTLTCCNCMDVCEGVSLEQQLNGYRDNCQECGALDLCDRCKVQLPNGDNMCLQCLLTPRDEIGSYSDHVDEQGVGFFHGQFFALTRAQTIRWASVNNMQHCRCVSGCKNCIDQAPWVHNSPRIVLDEMD
jgi:hypothetical protein